MPVIDDIRENNSKMKGKGIKAQFQYFWDYYKIPTLIVALVAIFAVSIIKTMVTAKDCAFEAIIINAADAPSEEEFAEFAEIDTEEFDVIFDSGYFISSDPESIDQNTYVNSQKIMAVVSAAAADVMFGDPAVITNYMGADFFADIRDYLTDAEFAEFEANSKIIRYQPVDEDTGAPIGDEFPIAINIGDSPRLEACLLGDDVYLTILVNTKQPENVKKFIDWLY